MWSLFCFTIVLDFSAPPSHKINNNILIYLTSYGILAPPSPCHQDKVEYCGVVGEIKILQKDNGEPISAIKIVKYCGACWGGGIGGRQNPIKDNGAPSLSSLR